MFATEFIWSDCMMLALYIFLFYSALKWMFWQIVGWSCFIAHILFLVRFSLCL